MASTGNVQQFLKKSDTAAYCILIEFSVNNYYRQKNSSLVKFIAER